MRTRSASRGMAAVVGLLAVFVVVPAVLVGVGRARFGHASPLHGMDAPWRWTLDAARSWWHRLTDQLDTSSELIDLFVRGALVLAWVCVAVVVATVIGEVVYQLRHGMPSSGHRNVIGLAWIGRVVAGGLVALLPLAAPAPALAGGPVLRGAPVASSTISSTSPTAAVPVLAPAAAGRAAAAIPVAPPWTTYVVQRGDSVWSIAGRIAGPTGDLDAVAARIVEANRGATMADGRRFTTPALIEPGWHLAVPAMPGEVPIAAPPPTTEHVVVPGDSYWRIAEAHLTAARGELPGDADVLAHTQALIAANAGRLGHDDPHLILPGETVVLVEPDVAAPPAPGPMAPVVLAAADTGPAGQAAPAGSEPDPAGPGSVPAPDAPPPVVVGAEPADRETGPGEVGSLPAADLIPPVTAGGAGAPVAGSVPTTDAMPPVVVAEPGSREAGAAEVGSRTAADLMPPLLAATRGDRSAGTSSASDPVGGPAERNVVADATIDRHQTSPVGMALGMSTLFATGVLGLVAARRRQRLRAATIGQRLPAPSSWAMATERELRAVAAPERMARLDVALRIAAPDLAAEGARIVAVEVMADGELRLTADRPATPSRGPWEVGAGGAPWTLPSRWSLEELAGVARRPMVPCPALAHVGSTAGGQLYVDLEAAGLLVVDLPEPMATDVVRCIAASVALSPLAGGIQIVTVGLSAELPTAASTSIDAAATLDAALEMAAAALGTTRATARGTSTFALRSQGLVGEAWEPAVVIASGDPGGALGAARTAAGDGLAVVVTARAGDADWRIELCDGQVVLAPLGIAITPCGLSVGVLADVRELLAAAAAPLELRARVVPLPPAEDRQAGGDPDLDDAAADAVDDAEPPWALLVRLFGQVEVVTADGAPATFEKSKSLELIVWLSQHRRRATRTGARTALWDVAVQDSTFANVVSDARRGMARAVPPPVGDEWLARTLTEDLVLHDDVVTDADLLVARIERARRRPAREAIRVLRPGVELLTGMPFAGTSYLWPDAEGLGSSLTLLGIGAALQLANLCLDLGDTEGVFWATGQGLQVLSGHEELIALRMRAHAAAGDLAGVRQEWAAYERAIDADPWSAGRPSPKLLAVRHDLLSTPSSAAAGA